MFRCESAGMFKVTTDCVGMEPGTHQAIEAMMHHDVKSEDGIVLEAAPVFSTEKPFEGELCKHEVDWLSSIPGKFFSASWRFKVESM